MRQLIVIIALGLALPLTGCASHKEVTARDKRPAQLASFAVEEQRPTTPAALQLQNLGRVV